MSGFSFITYQDNQLADGEICLSIKQMNEANPEKKYVPAYVFNIVLMSSQAVIGAIDIRIGYTDDLVWYGGQIGYRIDPEYRGHSYASKACKLIKQVALDHSMDVIWITCAEDNYPSCRTLEKLECTKLALMTLPEYHDLYKRGGRKVWRYRWVLNQ